MTTGHVVTHASGLSLDDCCFMGYRYDKAVGFVWDQVESWVLRRDADRVDPLLSWGGWFTDLWLAPSGTVYVSTAGAVYRSTPKDEKKQKWSHTSDQVDGALAGIWGIDDQFVFTWGGVGDKNVMFLWEGKSWREVPSPGYVIGVHGSSRDLVYAVGLQGLLARWNGNGWDRIPSQTETTLSRVFVAGPDEMYAVGSGGALLQGSIHGWSLLTVAPHALHDVACHKGKVWVAGGPQGLFTLDGRNLTLFKDKAKAERFDVRGELLVSAGFNILQLAPDGTFDTAGMNGFISVTQDKKPYWLEKRP